MSEAELFMWASAHDFRRKRNVSIPRMLLAVVLASVIAFGALFVVQSMQSLSARLDPQLSLVPAAVEQLHHGAEIAHTTASIERLDAARLTPSQREELSRSGATYAVDCAALGADWGAIARELGDGIACGVHR